MSKRELRKIAREIKQIKARLLNSSENLDWKKMKTPTGSEIAEAFYFMSKARNWDTESWSGGLCEEIAQSVLAVTKGKAKVFEVRTDDLRGIHYYTEYQGQVLNEGLEYYEEDWGPTLRTEQTKLSPSRLPGDIFAMEILFVVDLIRKGLEKSYNLDMFFDWYDQL